MEAGSWWPAGGRCGETRKVGRVRSLETNNDITKRKEAEARLRESEQRYRYIFDSTGVSIWEEDFSQVKVAIDELRSRGVRDFSEYFAAHPEFVRLAITMVKIVERQQRIDQAVRGPEQG